MSVKPNAQWFRALEQIYRDEPSGLAIQFDVLASGDSRIRVTHPDLPGGGHEVVFGTDGEWFSSIAPSRVCPRIGWIGGVLTTRDKSP